MTTPKCKRCKEPCQKYGGIGGYSVQCKACNERAGVLRRASYARNHPKPTYAMIDVAKEMLAFSERRTVPKKSSAEIYKEALEEMRRERDKVQHAIEKLEALL